MAWEDVKDILRPESVHMGTMKVDAELCSKCGRCATNCVTGSWKMGENDIPRLTKNCKCLSCYNCMAFCPEEAISIVESYHVDNGFWATDPHPLPAKYPLDPKDADGNPDAWTTVEQAIFERRSVRAFKNKQVPDHLIRRVVEAGRYAPSSGNAQPWKFIVITDNALITEMDEAIYPLLSGLYNMYLNDDLVKNLEFIVKDSMPCPPFDPRMILGGFGGWADKHMLPSLGAPAVIMIAGDERAIAGPEMQVGICGQNMCLAANSLGIRSCWVGVYMIIEQMPDLKAKLGIKKPWKIISAVVLGYPKFNQDGIVPREYRPLTWLRNGWDNPEIEE